MTSPEHHVMSALKQVHLTLSGQLTYIQNLRKVVNVDGCCISMTSAANSLDKQPFNVSAPRDTHVRYFIHMYTSGILYPYVQGQVPYKYIVKKCMTYLYSTQPTDSKITT